MPRKLFLKPAKGMAVWLPSRGRNIFDEGEMVAVDTFVSRCIAEGSLVEASEKNAKANGSKVAENARTFKHKGDK